MPVKRPLLHMMGERFPDFRFTEERQGTYGFLRSRGDFWYDYLTIDRIFDSGRGILAVNWYLTGMGCVPNWYDWAQSPWRLDVRTLRWETDPAEPASSLADPGPLGQIRYQWGTQKMLGAALDVLADKLQRYALPAIDRLAERPLTFELRRWHALAERILPQIDALPSEEREALCLWQKAAARRREKGDPPLCLQRWMAEILELPGFREEYHQSPILRDWIFNYFTHALGVRV